MTRTVSIGNISIGGDNPLVLIAGPCVIESEDAALRIAESIKTIADRVGISCIFKASYDKANRTSITSYRGPGLEEGLKILTAIKNQVDIPILSDVHGPEEAVAASQVLDVMQIPAFLCRQTDLLTTAAQQGKPINIKKGQFLAPHDIAAATKKVTASNNYDILLTERGTSFGYNNLVVDMRSLVIMSDLGFPVIFDATHSVQLPGGQGTSSGGDRRFVQPLAMAAAAVGVDGIFLEVHDNPDKALCDGPNSYKLKDLPLLLEKLISLSIIARGKKQNES